MSLAKRRPIRMPKLLSAADGEACTVCGCQDGTVVFCHLNESWAGKGMSQKADDCAGFFGCRRCHDFYDRRSNGPIRLTDGVILRAYYRTVRRLIEKGVLR